MRSIRHRPSRSTHSSPRRAAAVSLVAAVVAALIAITVVVPAPWGQTPRAVATVSSDARSAKIIAGATATTTTIPSTTTSTSTSTTTSTTTTTLPVTSGDLIQKGPSRSECLEPDVLGTGLKNLQASITRFNTETDTSVTCVSAYLNGATTWTSWVHPWVADKTYGYSAWVGEAPQGRQLILGFSLVPNSLANSANPLKWERTCAQGAFNSYASQLGTSLVHAGLENSVLRPGPEMNGQWESDFMGFTKVEQRTWANCFAQEVTALRKVPGSHFLIDWNPNACVENIPYANFYPGNAYVDILGLDLFDESCVAPTTHYTFQQLAHEPASLSMFEAFAAVTKKPMSIPEWALSAVPVTDDPGYVCGIGAVFTHGDFAFESYFNYQKPQPLLGPKTPLALAAFQKWFRIKSTS